MRKLKGTLKGMALRLAASLECDDSVDKQPYSMSHVGYDNLIRDYRGKLYLTDNFYIVVARRQSVS